MRRLDAIEPGHANVQQYDVRGGFGREPDSLLAVAGLGDHLVLVEIVQELPQPVARGLFVVNDQDLHRRITPLPLREGISG